jgi:uncharacterized repeat protein (TIGR01451 family)
MAKKIIITFLIVLAVAGASWAAGTSEGTVITARAASLNATYDDGQGGAAQNLNKALLTDVDKAITAIYGLLYQAGSSTIETVVAGGVNEHVTRLLTVRNNANTADAITCATSNAVLHQVAGDGSVLNDWLAGLSFGLSDPNPAEDADVAVTIGVTIPALAVNGTSLNIDLSADTASTPVGQYTGWNGTSYGGSAQQLRTATFLTQGTPYLEVVSRTSEVTAPAGYTGGANDAVPGARIKYTVVVKNAAPTSSAAAANIAFNDQTPVNSTYYAAEPMSFTADDGVAFTTANVAGALTWTQSNSGTNSLKVGSFVTLNFTVTID